MTHPALESLLAAYNEERQTSFTPAEFEHMIYFVPMLMVAVSDMNVDGVEMGYLTGLLAEQTLSAQGKVNTELLEQYIAELRYLLSHITEWEKRILETLRQLLKQNTDRRERLRVQMVAVAMASRGINQYEQARIKGLCDQLGIEL